MKRIISLVLILTLVLSLASCGGGGISGSYEGKVESTLGSYTITFNFNGNKVEIVNTLEAFGLIEVKPESINASYTLDEAEDGSQVIIFNLGGESSVAGVIEADVPLHFEQGSDYIKIGILKFTKK